MVLRERVEQNVVRGPWWRVWGDKTGRAGVEWRFLEWAVGTAKAGRAGGGSPSPVSAWTGGLQGEVWWENHSFQNGRGGLGNSWRVAPVGQIPLTYICRSAASVPPPRVSPGCPQG